MANKRVFFSFDFDEDQKLKHHIVGQLKLDTSPFAALCVNLVPYTPCLG